MDDYIEGKNVTKDVSDLLSEIKNFGIQIFEDEINLGKEDAWRDAGVVITNVIPSDDESILLGFSPIYVVTPFVAELSWCFCILRDMFKEYLDSASKFEFFRRLANTANNFSASFGINATARGLITIMVGEAFSIAQEIENGDFNYGTMTSENNINDDICDLHVKLKDLLGQIQKGEIGKENAWKVADVIITDAIPSDDGANPGRSSPLYIVTPFVAELSWLFVRLWDMFNIFYDYESKSEFFGRLTDAANRFMTASGINTTACGLLIGTAAEAIFIAEEIQREFSVVDSNFREFCKDDIRDIK